MFKSSKQRAAFFAMKNIKDKGLIKPMEPIKKIDPEKEMNDLLKLNEPKIIKPENPLSFSKLKKLMKLKNKV
jgi:hypothetical protein